ncbi:Mitochondrial acidic protein [Salix suchowensis]|nr:Mitochondrial acidic protein [Salix suchowensis]
MSATRALRQLASVSTRRTFASAPRVVATAFRFVPSATRPRGDSARVLVSTCHLCIPLTGGNRFSPISRPKPCSEVARGVEIRQEAANASPEVPEFLKTFKSRVFGRWAGSCLLHDCAKLFLASRLRIPPEVTKLPSLGNSAMKNIAAEDEEADFNEGEEAAGQEGEDSEDPLHSYPIRASLSITKTNGPGALNVDMMCQDGHFIIDSISFYRDSQLGTELTAEADWKRRGLYIGPQFESLDVLVQEEFEKFLQERGVNESLALFIPEYAEHKEQLAVMLSLVLRDLLFFWGGRDGWTCFGIKYPACLPKSARFPSSSLPSSLEAPSHLSQPNVFYSLFIPSEASFASFSSFSSGLYVLYISVGEAQAEAVLPQRLQVGDRAPQRALNDQCARSQNSWFLNQNLLNKDINRSRRRAFSILHRRFLSLSRSVPLSRISPETREVLRANVPQIVMNRRQRKYNEFFNGMGLKEGAGAAKKEAVKAKATGKDTSAKKPATSAEGNTKTSKGRQNTGKKATGNAKTQSTGSANAPVNAPALESPPCLSPPPAELPTSSLLSMEPAGGAEPSVARPPQPASLFGYRSPRLPIYLLASASLTIHDNDDGFVRRNNVPSMLTSQLGLMFIRSSKRPHESEKAAVRMFQILCPTKPCPDKRLKRKDQLYGGGSQSRLPTVTLKRTTAAMLLGSGVGRRGSRIWTPSLQQEFVGSRRHIVAVRVERRVAQEDDRTRVDHDHVL